MDISAVVKLLSLVIPLIVIALTKYLFSSRAVRHADKSLAQQFESLKLSLSAGQPAAVLETLEQILLFTVDVSEVQKGNPKARLAILRVLQWQVESIGLIRNDPRILPETTFAILEELAWLVEEQAELLNLPKIYSWVNGKLNSKIESLFDSRQLRKMELLPELRQQWLAGKRMG